MDQALCIGINYIGMYRELHGCLNDAHDWAAALERRGFEVQRLLESRATRAAILAGIGDCIAAAGSDGVCVITYAGHGSYRAGDDPETRDNVWCPIDYGNGVCVGEEDLQELVRTRCSGARVILVTDACFSGAMTKAGPRVHRRVRFLPPSKVLSQPDAVDATFARRAPRSLPWTALHACASDQVAYEGEIDGWLNGAFSYRALRALEKLDPKATYRDWLDVIRRSLPSGTYPQTPALYGAPDEPVFGRLAAPVLVDETATAGYSSSRSV